MKTIKANSWEDVPKNYTGIVELPSGTKYWYKDGLWHREDGPAVEHSTGYKDWCLEDEMYDQIFLENYVVLDHSKGKHGIMWYKLLDKNQIFEHPDIPGLIKK